MPTKAQGRGSTSGLATQTCDRSRSLRHLTSSCTTETLATPSKTSSKKRPAASSEHLSGKELRTLSPSTTAPLMQPVASGWAKVRTRLAGDTKEEKAVNRMDFKESSPRPRFVGQTLLEQLAVGQESGRDYTNRMAQIKEFAQGMPLRTHSQKDTVLLAFLNQCFDEGAELAEGTKYLAAFIDHYPSVSDKGKLLRSRRALKGWRNADPGNTKMPMAWFLIALIALDIAERSGLQGCLMVLLMFSTYIRPGEADKLREKHLILPGISSFYAINLHDSGDLELSKMKLTDETILLDSTTLPYLGEALARMLWASPESKLFKLNSQVMSAQWRTTLIALNLEPADFQLRQLRHSGPSWDRLMKLRSSLEVKDRGRWASDGARRRYEAHARVAQDFAKLPKSLQQRAKAAPAALDKLIHARLKF